MLGYKINKNLSIKTRLLAKSISLIEFCRTMRDFTPGTVLISNHLYMARSIDPRKTNEEKDILEYSEHMSLLRQIIRIVIRRDRVKERQG